MDGSVVTAIASFLVASVAAASAYASQRAASKATTTTSRNEAERDAYSRARTFDTETIARQDREIDELRLENRELRDKVHEVELENSNLNRKMRAMVERINRLEKDRQRDSPWFPSTEENKNEQPKPEPERREDI